MENYSIADEDWQMLLGFFPQGWEQQAVQRGAVARLRGFRSSEAVLRTLLLHVAKGYSLRETVARAKMAGLAEVSDVALLKRLRSSEEWLRTLCQLLLKENGNQTASAETRNPASFGRWDTRQRTWENGQPMANSL